MAFGVGGAVGRGDRAARRRGGGETGVFDGNEGRSAGATMPEERGMPGGDAGDVLRGRGGGKRAGEGLSGQKNYEDSLTAESHLRIW